VGRAGQGMAAPGEAAGAPALRAGGEGSEARGLLAEAAVDAVQRACLLALQVHPGCTLRRSLPPLVPATTFMLWPHALPSDTLCRVAISLGAARRLGCGAGGTPRV